MTSGQTPQGPPAGSRRRFLKLSTASVVGGALAGGLSFARFAHAAGDETIKIALIGCGARGRGAANQALSTAGPVKLIALADVFEDQVETAHSTLLAEKPRLAVEPTGIPARSVTDPAPAFVAVSAADLKGSAITMPRS